MGASTDGEELPCQRQWSPGGDKQDVRELRALNRVLSWRSGGIQLEADPRHQEILISELEQDVRGPSTPGVTDQQRK